MESIKLKNKYIDTSGVYDSTEGKTQDEINAEKYTTPSGGIPKSDLSSTVQASLDLADSAIQQHQSLSAYRTSAAQDTIDAGKVNTADYNPTAKTSAMTKAVGKDSNGQLWTEPVESSEVVSATENWLSENIAQETGYVIDDSLSVTGAAADAKVTGDKLREITTNFDNLFKIDINWEDYGTAARPNGWANGSYSITTGALNSTTMRYGRSTGKVAAPENCQYLFVKSYNDSYGILIAEYDENGTFITSHGNTVGENKTVTLLIKAYPNHMYGFSVGIFPSGLSAAQVNTGTDYLTDTNVSNIKAYFLTSSRHGVFPESNISESCLSSTLGGHVMEYKTIGKPMEIYKNVNGQAEYSFSVPASDYIRCNPNYTYNLLINPAETSAKYYINIYDRNHNIDLTYFNHPNGDGIINCFSAQELANLNGFQFSNLPDGYYIRYSISPYDTEYRMYVWDGVRCGLPLNSEMRSFNSGSNATTVLIMPSSGESIVTIPGGCKCIIAKPGYTFVDMRYINIANDKISSSSPYSNISANGKNMRFPSQVCYLNKDRVYSLIIRKNYNYETGESSKEHAECDMSPYMCVIPSDEDPGVFSTETGFGRINHTIKKIKNIEDLKWTCKGNTGNFKEGVTYYGVPYRSDWTRACYYGWHISSRTFINAVNDEDSYFYEYQEKKSSTDSTLVNKPYYCLVCSSYGALVSLFPYPCTNYSMMHDPNYQIQYSSDYEIGGLISDGAPDGKGHCFVPIAKTQNSGSQLSAVTISEASGYSTRRRNCYRELFDNHNALVGASGTFYMRRFVYNVKYLKNYTIVTPYDISPDVTPTNGSARPHKGDCSVYTSYSDIIINIKDLNADRIYYQKVSCTFSDGYNGIPKNVSDAGTAKYILLSSIDAKNKTDTNNSRKIVLRSSKNLEDGTCAIKDAGHSDLESGAIYAVWASNGESTRPNNGDTESQNKYELFEWYEVHSDEARIYYAIENGKLVIYSKKNGIYVKANNTDNKVEFWYVRTYGVSADDSIRDSDYGMVSIPYEENNDYSKYTAKFTISPSRDLFFFRKGQLGAYYQQGIILAKAYADDLKNGKILWNNIPWNNYPEPEQLQNDTHDKLARAYADDLKNEKILWNNIPWDNYPEQLQNNIDEKLRDDVSNGKLTAAKYESITGKSYNS